MNYSEKLYDYMDGALDSVSESDLFRELATNHDLRMEMRQAIEVKTAITGYPEIYVPSPESTNKIFAAIGFSAPGIATTSLGVASKWKFLGMFGKYSQAVYTGVASAVLSSIATILLLMNSDMIEGNSSDVNKNYTSNKNITQQYNSFTNYIADNFQKLGNQNMKTEDLLFGSKFYVYDAPPPKEKTIIKYVYVDAESNEKVEAPSVQNIVYVKEDTEPLKYYSNSFVSPSQYLLMNPLKYRHDMQKDTDPRINNFPDIIPIEFDRSELGSNIFEDMNFQISSIQTRSTVQETVAPEKLNELNNFIAALNFELTSNFEIGVEVRQETFFVVDKIQNENTGKYENVEVQPNLTTIGILNLKQKFTEIYSTQPYINFNFGVNDIGWVGRFGTGLEFNTQNDFGFVIGLEYSRLGYQIQSETLNAQKVGFLFGMKWGL